VILLSILIFLLGRWKKIDGKKKKNLFS